MDPSKIYKLRLSDDRLNIDDHEHLIHLYNLPLMKKRAIQELHGMSAAVIYDGKITDEEITLIASWLEKHAEVKEEWPVSRLFSLLSDILKDEIITEGERTELLAFLSCISSSPDGPCTAEGIFASNPVIQFPQKCFMFTGNLQFGKRQKAENEVVKRAGSVREGSYLPFVDYLVVGDLGQKAWKYGRYGAKIEACMKAVSSKSALTAIVREMDFVKAIVGDPISSDRS
jgi:hypothetical protein